MIVDRNLISKNFQYLDLDEKLKSRHELFTRIDYWKNILVKKCAAERQQTIAVGITKIYFDYFAIVFAGLELGLQFVILDYSSRADELGIKDFKNDVYGTIDIFLHSLPGDGGVDPIKIEKLLYYSKKSKIVYDISELENLDIEIDQNINAIKPESDDYMLFCTSSGTTGTPKIVKHTHHFMRSLVERNKNLYKDSVLHIRNLHHGSSLAVFFLPTIASDDVSFHTGFGYGIHTEKELLELAQIASKKDIKNISFPFSSDIDMFLKVSKENNITFNNLCLYTLSYINTKWKNYFDLGINKFESIFGCNETSGPLFLSKLTPDNLFDTTHFEQIDNFYSFEIKNEFLEVTLPIYNTKIVMNDVFEHKDKLWIYKGRKDFVKINQIELDLKQISTFASKNGIDGEIITDTIQNTLYLACWSTHSRKIILNLQEKIKSINSRLEISKVEVLDKNLFYRGIKLDKEMIRAYFRSL